MGDVNCELPTSNAWISRPVGTRRLMMLTLTYLTTNEKNVIELITPSLKLFTTHCRLGHTVLGALVHCGPLWWQSNKAILFYYTQDLISVSGYRGQIRFHFQF